MNRKCGEHLAQIGLILPPGKWQAWLGMLALVLFLSGGLCGIEMEKRQTADELTAINSQMERVQTPQVPAMAPKKALKQNRRAAEAP